jgi:hypothetical protein
MVMVMVGTIFGKSVLAWAMVDGGHLHGGWWVKGMYGDGGW